MFSCHFEEQRDEESYLKKGTNNMKERITRLLCVKSIVTILLTAVFAALALTGRVETDQFMTVFTVIIAFYFGTQTERARQEG